MDKKKVLWCSDLMCRSGFGNVAKHLTKALTPTFDVVGLGINYTGAVKVSDDWAHFSHITPAQQIPADVYGIQTIVPMVKYHKPDVIVMFNDYFVIFEWQKQLKAAGLEHIPTVVYFPVDSHSIPEAYKRVAGTKTYSYSHFANSITGREDEVVYHGVNTKVFKPIKREDFKLFNKEDEKVFSVLAASQFQVRKGWHILLRGFLEFNKKYPNSKLMLHTPLESKSMGQTGPSGSFLQLLDTCGVTQQQMDDRAIVLTGVHQQLTDEQMAELYNIGDVFITTNLGEGFGLTTMEAYACGTPVIVPDNTIHRELFGNKARYMPCTTESIFSQDNCNLRLGTTKEEVALALEEEYKLWLESEGKVQDSTKHDFVRRNFSWTKPQHQMFEGVYNCIPKTNPS